MNETKEKKKKSFEERLVELHPRFLDTVKEVYPLAVLSSLCIAITAFTQQTYPQVPQYSIAAASMFLIAFIISFAFKILSISYLAFISYVCTALAIFFLLLVIYEFSKAIPVISKTMSLIPTTFTVITTVSLFFVLGRIANKTKSKIIRLCGLISIPFMIPFLIIEILTILGKFIDSEIISSQIFMVGVLTVLVSLIFLTIAGVLIHNERKKQEESEKKQTKQ